MQVKFLLIKNERTYKVIKAMLHFVGASNIRVANICNFVRLEIPVTKYHSISKMKSFRAEKQEGNLYHYNSRCMIERL